MSQKVPELLIAGNWESISGERLVLILKELLPAVGRERIQNSPDVWLSLVYLF